MGSCVFIFNEITNGVFHASNVLVKVMDLWKSRVVTEFLDKLFCAVVFAKVELLIVDTLGVHELG